VCIVLGAGVMDVPLRIGDAFPRLTGEAISGRAIEVPAQKPTTPVVVVMSFSRAAGTEAQQWDELLTRDRTNGDVEVIVVAEIQSVPRLIRRTVAYAIRRGVPQSLRDRMIVLDHDDEAWRTRLSVKSTEHAYAVLVDTAGKVGWLSDERSIDDNVARLREAAGRLKK
jgi:hypothetical protein